MEIKRVIIGEDISDYLQRLNYELLGYRNLISSLVTNTNSELKYTDNHYRQLMQEYRKLNIEYMLSMDELKQEYIPDVEMKESVVSISINFDKCEVLFYTGGGCSIHE